MYNNGGAAGAADVLFDASDSSNIGWVLQNNQMLSTVSGIKSVIENNYANNNVNIFKNNYFVSTTTKSSSSQYEMNYGDDLNPSTGAYTRTYWGLNINPTGTIVDLGNDINDGGRGMRIKSTSGRANYPYFASVGVGSGPVMTTQGADANINFNIQTKGSGSILVNSPATFNGGAVIPYSAVGSSSIPINTFTVNSANNSEKQITVSSQPTYTFPEATATEFAGDFSKTFMPLSYTVTGVATLGQPTTGYQWSPAVTPYQTLVTNSSGWNQSTSTNSGRTGFGIKRSLMLQNGQGDMVDNYTFCQVSTSRSGATHWLANPACSSYAADFGSIVNHAYLQGIGDFNFTDNGYDIAAIADVRNFNRTVNTAAFGDIWMGYRTQSTGTKAIDVGSSFSGGHVVAVDTSQATGMQVTILLL
jgi:hypothetical protein